MGFDAETFKEYVRARGGEVEYSVWLGAASTAMWRYVNEKSLYHKAVIPADVAQQMMADGLLVEKSSLPSSINPSITITTYVCKV